MLEVCKAVVDDWHSKNANFHKKEPEYLTLARQAIEATE
jgi:hypothetical protein